VQSVGEEVLDRVSFGSEDLGQVYAFLGNVEHCLAALERAYLERSGSRSILSMKVNPAYDFIRERPEFQELQRRVGLAN